ncbi:hypothetical protein BurJ1DRAFT_4809 [Burkholderiales bacterium JOSHI_001]|nr:hypothetical protein BurJ1DRAFT_4809 [Burkholderiales bacterium JOSHI_001]
MKIHTTLAALVLAAAATAAAAGPADASAPLRGEVLEAKEVDAYTYLRLKTAEGETWAAVMKAPVKVGNVVTVGDPMTMANFESKALKKTFDKIVFGTLVNVGTAGTAPQPALPSAVAPAAPAVKVAKASGADARTVADVHAGKAKLKDGTVTVRGRVVKVNAGIRGMNWLHLQDGTGAAANGSDDLIVVTPQMANVGDTVTIKGTVRTDVKVGPGYEYAVLVDGATVALK